MGPSGGLHGDSRLLIVCGVPGAGKSTLARYVDERWNSVSFASEDFVTNLGADARGASGDLSQAAMATAYSEMARAVIAALGTECLVLAVGSFRTETVRREFRDIGNRAGAAVTVIRVVCPVATAALRIRARLLLGEGGPTEGTIRYINTELDRAIDIDRCFRNESSVCEFHRQIDLMMQSLVSRR